MRVIRSHKIALDPTPKQLALLVCAVGVARFAYNWALAQWADQYKSGQKPNEVVLRKQQQFPWMLAVPKSIVQQSIKNLGSAFKGFFRKQSRYPRFKKRGVYDSARFDNGPGTFEFSNRKIKLPVLGWIKLREDFRFSGGKPLSATISREADRWFVSVPIETEWSIPLRENQAEVGIDFGLLTFAALSNGEKIGAPKPLKGYLLKLRRLSRQLSRKNKGSNNRSKARRKLARLHQKIKNVRQDFLHKFTTKIVKQFSSIGIEDLNVKGMIKNHRLARSISDVGWSEARRQLEYKALLYESELFVHDRWFASSKTCSACGSVVDDLPLSIRMWTCKCGAVLDRDLNAATNLKPTTASSAGSHACREISSGVVDFNDAKLISKKQELISRQMMRN